MLTSIFQGQIFFRIQGQAYQRCSAENVKRASHSHKLLYLQKYVILFGPIHTNPGRLKPVSIVYKKQNKTKHPEEWFQKNFSKKNQVSCGILLLTRALHNLNVSLSSLHAIQYPYRLVCLWYVTRHVVIQLSLSNEHVDVLHIKNNSWKLISSRFKRSDSITSPYKSKNTKKNNNKQTKKLSVVIHDGQDGSVLVAQARYPFTSFAKWEYVTRSTHVVCKYKSCSLTTKK